MKIGDKVKKIMHEGMRGKKVPQKQAVAYSMAEKAKRLRKKK